MIPTKRIWTAKPFLVAYVVVVGFTVGLLVNRTPRSVDALPAVAEAGGNQHGASEGEHEAKEPPLWLQLFRPSQATARVLLRTGMPHLAVADGSALAHESRNFVVYWTGKQGNTPQTLFQTVLPFLRQTAQAADKGPDTEVPPGPETTPNPPAVEPPGPSESPKAAEESPPQAVEPPVKSKPAINMGLPLVGIYHTHDYESYLSEFPGLSVKTEKDLASIVSYDHKKRTIVGLGNTLAMALRDEGITTVHAPWKHQDLGYDFAYRSSRSTVKKILKEAPSTKILLDLHRDGVLGMNSTTVVAGKKVTQIRCIIGQYEQPKWEKNKTFCESLMARVEKMYPGMTLPTRVQNDTYNQDLLPGAILLEIGNALNRYDEAERAVLHLAKALASMINEGAYPH